jgi:hypothetical protein
MMNSELELNNIVKNAVIVQFETTNRHHSEFLSHEVFLDHENKIYYHSFL